MCSAAGARSGEGDGADGLAPSTPLLHQISGRGDGSGCSIAARPRCIDGPLRCSSRRPDVDATEPDEAAQARRTEMVSYRLPPFRGRQPSGARHVCREACRTERPWRCTLDADLPHLMTRSARRAPTIRGHTHPATGRRTTRVRANSNRLGHGWFPSCPIPPTQSTTSRASSALCCAASTEGSIHGSTSMVQPSPNRRRLFHFSGVMETMLSALHWNLRGCSAYPPTTPKFPVLSVCWQQLNPPRRRHGPTQGVCLLYTSDAADE